MLQVQVVRQPGLPPHPLGIGQQALRDATGAILVVTDTRVRYLRPARLDDWIEVSATLAERGRASLALAQQAWRGEELLAEGEIRIGCVDAATMRPRRLPPELLERLPA